MADLERLEETRCSRLAPCVDHNITASFEQHTVTTRSPRAIWMIGGSGVGLRCPFPSWYPLVFVGHRDLSGTVLRRGRRPMPWGGRSAPRCAVGWAYVYEFTRY